MDLGIGMVKYILDSNFHIYFRTQISSQLLISLKLDPSDRSRLALSNKPKIAYTRPQISKLFHSKVSAEIIP